MLVPLLRVALSAAGLPGKLSTTATIHLSSLDSRNCLEALSHRSESLEYVFADCVFDTCSNCFVSFGTVSPWSIEGDAAVVDCCRNRVMA